MLSTPILGYCAKCDCAADQVSCSFDPHANEYVVTIQHHGESAIIRVPGIKIAAAREKRADLTVTAFDRKAA
jgi:hypothetical protein